MWRVLSTLFADNGENAHWPWSADWRSGLILEADPHVIDFAQTVKQQADIVKVIEGYIRLRKAGAQNYSGLCPFHKEKSPSFSVHAVRQF